MHKPSLRLRTSKPNLQSNSSSFCLFETPSTITNTTNGALLPLTPSSMTTSPTLASPASVKTTHTDTGSISAMNGGQANTNTAGAIGLHRGAIDKAAVTVRPPSEVMTLVRDVLDSIGICVQPESNFKFRCIRPPQSSNGSETPPEGLEPNPPEISPNTIYANDPSRDPAGEVRFTVELTRLAGLNDTYSLDIRRLKGNLRSYQFLYETIRDRAPLAP